MKRLILMSTLAVAAAPVMAHTGAHEGSGMLAGFSHPIGGTDHLLAMIAVGILAMQQGGRALWTLPAAFVAMMLVGGAMGMAGMSVPAMELGIVGSVIVFGSVIAAGRQLPLMAVVPLVGAFAIFHGVAHGAEMPMAVSGLQYALGFAAATALLHGIGVAVGFTGQKVAANAMPMVLRVMGGITALLGFGLLAA